MKGFIEVTFDFSNDVLLVHYTQIQFIKVGSTYQAMVNDRWLKETYTQIKELIKQAQ